MKIRSLLLGSVAAVTLVALATPTFAATDMVGVDSVKSNTMIVVAGAFAAADPLFDAKALDYGKSFSDAAMIGSDPGGSRAAICQPLGDKADVNLINGFGEIDLGAGPASMATAACQAHDAFGDGFHFRS